MDLADWLGDEPGRIVRRSRYARAPWKFVLVALLVLLALYLLLSLVPAGGVTPHGGHRAFRIGDTWPTRAVVGVGVLLFAWCKGCSARKREYHAMLRRLGDELGLAYEQHSRRNPLDRFAWELKGERDGREVKLARVPEGFMGAEGRFVGAVVISVACQPPEPLSMFVGYRKDHAGAPMWTFPQAHLAGLGAWAANGELDPEAVGRLEVLEVLVMDRVRQAGIEVKEGRARLYYDLGSAVLDFDPLFVERAVRATIELAQLMEGREGGRSPRHG